MVRLILAVSLYAMMAAGWGAAASFPSTTAGPAVVADAATHICNSPQTAHSATRAFRALRKLHERFVNLAIRISSVGIDQPAYDDEEAVAACGSVPGGPEKTAFNLKKTPEPTEIE